MLFWKRTKSPNLKTFKLKLEFTMSNATQAEADAIAAQLNAAFAPIQAFVTANPGVDLTGVQTAAAQFTTLAATAPVVPAA